MSNQKNILHLINRINSKISFNKNLYKEKIRDIKEINKLLKIINLKGGAKILPKGKKSKKVNNLRVPNLNKSGKRNTYVDPKDLFEKKGILDPEGKAPNPFTGLPYENLYTEASKYPNTYAGYGSGEKGWCKLPMYSKSEKVIQEIYDNQVLLIISGTGSGKTVLTPKLALHAMNYQGKILITNPKKAPSEENAVYAAKCLDVKLGDEVGVKYRDSDPKLRSNKTKLLYCTDGTVLEYIKKDKMLSEYDCLIIDEAHERNVRIDMLLLETKELIERRPDFKLIIMSATINPDIFRNYFPNSQFKFAEVNAGKKPNFPVEQYYLDKPINKFDSEGTLINKKDFIIEMVDRIMKILKESDSGDILGFVTGASEGAEVCSQLQGRLKEFNNNNREKIFCRPLDGQTKGEEKTLILHNSKYKNKNGGYDRKVVIATEVAESSLTVDGLIYVIDSGLVNDSRYYPDTNISELAKRYISRASHDQRRGRVGRTAPGFCYNLFTEKEYENNKLFHEFATSPILTENIIKEILKFLNKTDMVSHVDLPFKYPRKNNKLSNTKPISLNEYLLKLIESPHENTVSEMVNRLIALGALEKKGNKAYLTEIGRAMNRFSGLNSVELRRALLSSYDYLCKKEMCNIAALIEIIGGRFEDLFLRFKDDKKKSNQERREMKNDYEKKRKKWSSSEGDLISFLKAYKEYEERKEKGDAKEWCRNNYFKERTMSRIRYLAKQYERELYFITKGARAEFYSNPNNKNKEFLLTHKEKPVLDGDSYKRVISALIDGLYVNIIRKGNRNSYVSCFTKNKISGRLSDRSLYDAIRSKAKFLCYIEFGSIFGNTSFRILTPVPPEHIQKIKNDPEKAEHLSFCLSDAKFDKILKGQSQSKQKGKQKKSGKKKYKKGKKKKKYKVKSW